VHRTPLVAERCCASRQTQTHIQLQRIDLLKTMIGNVIPEDEIKGMMMNHHPVVVGVRTGKARLFKSKERPRLYLDEHVLTNHLPNLFCFVTEKKYTLQLSSLQRMG